MDCFDRMEPLDPSCQCCRSTSESPRPAVRPGCRRCRAGGAGPTSKLRRINPDIAHEPSIRELDGVPVDDPNNLRVIRETLRTTEEPNGGNDGNLTDANGLGRHEHTVIS